MHGEIELDAGKAESLGIKDGDTKAFKIVFGRERCGGNARQRRKHRRTRTRSAIFIPFTVRVRDMHYNGGVQAPCAASCARSPGTKC